jgi:CheY-like chemotaxis protein
MSRRIGIVEDEGIVAMDIKNSLISLGYEVPFWVDSGEKALLNLEKFETDLLLMDIIIKGNIDGIATAKLIREKYKLPIIFLTAFEDEATLNSASNANADGFLIKPFEDSRLREIIENVFARANNLNG